MQRHDTSNATLRAGSLFSGIGGLDLVAEAVGARTVWQVENDPKASAVLARHWPDVPNLGDVTKVDWSEVELIDILTAGFPCQDISDAGKGGGIHGNRSGLWFEVVRAVRSLRPEILFVENVSALVRRGLPVVVGCLADLGYSATWGCFRASDEGAPHRRERLFLFATTADTVGLPNRTAGLEIVQRAIEPDAERCGSHPYGKWTPAVRQWEQLTRPAPPATAGNRLNPDFVEWMMGYPEGWTEGHSLSGRLKLCGNAVVPQSALAAFRSLALVHERLDNESDALAEMVAS